MGSQPLKPWLVCWVTRSTPSSKDVPSSSFAPRTRERRKVNTTQIPDWMGHVGPGWHQILTQLHEDIMAIDPGYKVLQIKEKFGGGRFYLQSEHLDVAPLVRAAEDESRRTCEGCGEPGFIRNRRNSRWMQCLCDSCVEKPQSNASD
jgi:hypothetical protein